MMQYVSSSWNQDLGKKKTSKKKNDYKKLKVLTETKRRTTHEIWEIIVVHEETPCHVFIECPT